MKTWAERIRRHATIHYMEDGWDILVEHWTDEYINEYIKDCKTYEQAVAKVSDALYLMDAFR